MKLTESGQIRRCIITAFLQRTKARVNSGFLQSTNVGVDLLIRPAVFQAPLAYLEAIPRLV